MTEGIHSKDDKIQESLRHMGYELSNGNGAEIN